MAAFQSTKKPEKQIAPREAWLPPAFTSRFFGGLLGGSVNRAYPTSEDIPAKNKAMVDKNIDQWRRQGQRRNLAAINEHHDRIVQKLAHQGNLFPFSPASAKNVSFGFPGPNIKLYR
eukprot:CAMPEP_0118940914 /NCGR_PEP_ID=MMETSP1169-20130426/32638_1 /TAXON_ID=36882 /ORGANISM="Pyramimonas obovata, Strain CCMP722" /LENGTH=116 /DNA_ID=CAMNT_0006885541 /DNA_START=210 /DNA_END=560 /DNA_ORIENTATION=+